MSSMSQGRLKSLFVVVDEYQGQGIGRGLMRHLTRIAREAGLREFTAEVLPDNISMFKVFEKSGLHLHVQGEPQVLHVALQL